ncbi:MAG: hypothetical protein AAF465_15730 [Pseudomonadota bacterium]
MPNGDTNNQNRKDNDGVDGAGGPVVIPAAAAFLGALVGAVIGSQLG